MVKFKLSKLFNPPVASPIKDAEAIDKTYRYWRIRTMYAMYIGYAAFYLCQLEE